MTPNLDSTEFIKHYIPEDASKAALKMGDVYELLKANASADAWQNVNEQNLLLTYNAHTLDVAIEVKFIDTNNHTHHFQFKLLGTSGNMISCEYRFEGGVDADVASIRSYVEWVVIQLWKYKINAELGSCDRSLKFDTNIDKIYDRISLMLDIVTNNIKSMDWFLSDDPVWKFHETFSDLRHIIRLLRREAIYERWKDVKPSNFRLLIDDDCALICLDYTDDINYVMQFRIGMKKGGFGEERTDKFIDMFYEFENIAKDKETAEYYDKENREFSRIANAVLEIPFKWNALLFHAEDGFYISTYRRNAFQKFCLMLDCIIPLKDTYEANRNCNPSEMSEMKRYIENELPGRFEVCDKKDSNLIFTAGHYEEEPDCIEIKDFYY